MVKGDRGTWKANYFLKIKQLFDEYPKCFIVGVDNVGSNQMQQIRIGLRGKAEVLMGKNTMMRRAIRTNIESNPNLDRLLPHLKGNVGFVFTKEDLIETRDLILINRKRAPAKAGALAPLDVFVDAQNTGLGPEKTSFFQALSIPTKIARGTIEILNEVHLIHAGNRVGASEATLLNMLNISPFTYGLVVTQVYDSGTCFSPAVLDITDDDLRIKLLEGLRNVAAISLAIGYPTMASAPHSIVNGFKNLLAVSVMTDYTFPEAEKTKEYLADPSKFASVVAAAAPAAADKKEDKKAAEPEEEDESDDDMGFGLFD